MQTVLLAGDSIFIRVPAPASLKARVTTMTASSVELTQQEAAEVIAKVQQVATPLGKCIKVCETYTTEDGREITICWCEWQ